MQIPIINKSCHPLPAYMTTGASGMDLRAFLQKPIQLAPLQRKLIGTGLYIALPHGYEAQIRPRSGLAYQKGITILNSPGTIDADYRGEIKILLVNLSHEPFIIQNGDRIAQMVIAKYESISWNDSHLLDQTERGDDGFGSTGQH